MCRANVLPSLGTTARGVGLNTARRKTLRGRELLLMLAAFSGIFVYGLLSFGHFTSVLLTKATRLPSGDHEGTLIVPCPPYT